MSNPHFEVRDLNPRETSPAESMSASMPERWSRSPDSTSPALRGHWLRREDRESGSQRPLSPPARQDAMKAVLSVAMRARDVAESWHYAQRGADLWAARSFFLHWKGIPIFVRSAWSLACRPLRRMLLAWLDFARAAGWSARRDELLSGKRVWQLLFRVFSAWRKQHFSRMLLAASTGSQRLEEEEHMDRLEPEEKLPLPRSDRSNPHPHPHPDMRQSSRAQGPQQSPEDELWRERGEVAKTCQQDGVGRLLPDWWRQYRLESKALEQWRSHRSVRRARRLEGGLRMVAFGEQRILEPSMSKWRAASQLRKHARSIAQDEYRPLRVVLVGLRLSRYLEDAENLAHSFYRWSLGVHVLQGCIRQMQERARRVGMQAVLWRWGEVAKDTRRRVALQQLEGGWSHLVLLGKLWRAWSAVASHLAHACCLVQSRVASAAHAQRGACFDAWRAALRCRQLLAELPSASASSVDASVLLRCLWGEVPARSRARAILRDAREAAALQAAWDGFCDGMQRTSVKMEQRHRVVAWRLNRMWSAWIVENAFAELRKVGDGAYRARAAARLGAKKQGTVEWGIMRTVLSAFNNNAAQHAAVKSMLERREHRMRSAAFSSWQDAVEHAARVREAEEAALQGWLRRLLARWHFVLRMSALSKSHQGRWSRVKALRCLFVWRDEAVAALRRVLSKRRIADRAAQRRRSRSFALLHAATCRLRLTRKRQQLGLYRSSVRIAGHVLRAWTEIVLSKQSLASKQLLGADRIDKSRTRVVLQEWQGVVANRHLKASSEAQRVRGERRRVQALAAWRSVVVRRGKREQMLATLLVRRWAACRGGTLWVWRWWTEQRRAVCKALERAQARRHRQQLRSSVAEWRAVCCRRLRVERVIREHSESDLAWVRVGSVFVEWRRRAELSCAALAAAHVDKAAAHRIRKLDLRTAMARLVAHCREATTIAHEASRRFGVHMSALKREVLLSWFWHAGWERVQCRRDDKLMLAVSKQRKRFSWSRWIAWLARREQRTRSSVAVVCAIWRIRGSQIRVEEGGFHVLSRSIADWRRVLDELERRGAMDLVWTRWGKAVQRRRHLRVQLSEVAEARTRSTVCHAFYAIKEHCEGCQFEQQIIQRGSCVSARIGLLAVLQGKHVLDLTPHEKRPPPFRLFDSQPDPDPHPTDSEEADSADLAVAAGVRLGDLSRWTASDSGLWWDERARSTFKQWAWAMRIARERRWRQARVAQVVQYRRKVATMQAWADGTMYMRWIWLRCAQHTKRREFQLCSMALQAIADAAALAKPREVKLQRGGVVHISSRHTPRAILARWRTAAVRGRANEERAERATHRRKRKAMSNVLSTWIFSLMPTYPADSILLLPP